MNVTRQAHEVSVNLKFGFVSWKSRRASGKAPTNEFSFCLTRYDRWCIRNE